MKTAKQGVLALLILAVAGAAAYFLWQRTQRPSAEFIELYGNVDIREVQLAFRQSGRLASMNAEEGDRVTAGAPLAQLDDTPYRQQLAAAQAKAERAKAELDKLQRGNRVQEVQQADQSVKRAEAALAYAVGELKRQAAVVNSGATTTHSLDLARSQRDQAEAELKSARQAFALKKEGFRTEDIAIAKAELASANASAALAETALDDTRLLAPADATVLSRVCEPGSMVNAQEPVYSLSLRNPVYVRAYVSERELGRAAPGSKVTVTTDSTAKTYHGQIGFVSPRAEFTPKSVETTELRTDLVYRLRIIVNDADTSLLQGMPVTVRLPTGRATAH